MTPPSTFRIAILDDHLLFLEGISLVVRNLDPNFDVETHTSSPELLSQLAAGEAYDLIICDLIMRDMNGLAFLSAMRQFSSPPPVIIMSGINDDPPIHQVKSLGGAAFIHKSMEIEDLEDVISKVRDGHRVFPSQELVPVIQGSVEGLDDEVVTTLTDRQKDILELLANGASNRDISNSLCISQNTVKTHLRQIFQIFGVTKRTACVQRARLLGFI